MRSFIRDDGVALVAVMGAIALISIISISGYMMSSQALHDTTRLSSETKAFQVAATGMDRELASFSESKFQNGSTTYTDTRTTPDGSYQLTVGRDAAVPFMFTMTCVGTSGGRTSTVEQKFFYMDLWGMSVSSGSNPNGNDFGSGAAWNGNSTIRGPMYVSGDVALNSNPDLYYGPLFVSNGSVAFNGGVQFHPYPNQKYKIFATGTVTGAGSGCEIFNSCPSIDLPWLDQAYFDGMKELARTQSSDNKLGATETANTEVATVAQPATYIATKMATATQYYKEINGPVVITGASPSFGDVTSPRDDFAFDTATNRLYVDGVVFVNGDLTIGSGVSSYAGNGIIVATGDITINTGAPPTYGLQPYTDDGDGVADDLTTEDCLGLAAGGDVTIIGSIFEGVVFTNNSLVLVKSGSIDGEFEGAVHANYINSDTPQNEIEMELEFTAADLPNAMPGSATDPRGAGFSSSGMVVPGTWVRR